MTALVTGATGCIGYALAARLAASGDYSQVRALVRPGRQNDLPPAVCAISGTLGDQNALQNAARNVDIVFHCAAKVHDANGKSEDFFGVNCDGTQNLLEACLAQNAIPPRFVFFSTVAVYGDETPPDGLPETASPNPQTPYAASKTQAENAVRIWGKKKNAPVSVLRVATVYGPRDRGNLARMMAAVAQNRYVQIGNGLNRKTCANVHNVVAVAEALAKSANGAVPNGLVVADAAPYTLRELADAMRNALLAEGWIFPPRRLPASLPVPVALAASAGLTGAAKLLNRNAPLTPAQVRRLAASNVYETKSLGTISGYFPVSDLSEGMREAAKWLIDAEKTQK